MGSLSCYEVCLACGSHSEAESVSRGNLFLVLRLTRSWGKTRQPSSLENLVSHSTATTGHAANHLDEVLRL
jgi:hypothetical protein